MHILLIDDDPYLHKFLKRPLTKHGHTVIEAYNGKEGWEVFLERSHAVDVILSDIDMPVLDGVELLKRLREKAYDIPVIIMTGHNDIQFSIEVLRLGAFDFLLKPFKVKDLLDVLDKLETIHLNRQKPLEDLACFIEQIEISIRSQTKLVASVVSFLQTRVRWFCELAKIDVRSMSLCLHEALANAVIHGNLEIPSELKNESPEAFEQLVQEREAQPEFADRPVRIRCTITPAELRFEIQDQGAGFDPKANSAELHPMKMLLTGRGLLIITASMDQVFWNETGNCVTMIKTLQRP